jgi:hypothetical protein
MGGMQMTNWLPEDQVAQPRFDFESKMARLNAAWLSNLTAAWQICGNFSANPWQLRFSRRQASAAKTYSPCRKKICAGAVASSLPQDSAVQLMFGAAGLGEAALSTSRDVRFRITARGDRAARRRTCRTSASRNAGFLTRRGCSPRHAAQVLQAMRFFATCLRFAATCLKFAARLVHSAAGRRACSLSPSTGVKISSSAKLPPLADIDKMPMA